MMGFHPQLIVGVSVWVSTDTVCPRRKLSPLILPFLLEQAEEYRQSRPHRWAAICPLRSRRQIHRKQNRAAA